MKKLYIFFLLSASLVISSNVNAQTSLTTNSPTCDPNYTTGFTTCGDGVGVGTLTFGTINYAPSSCSATNPYFRYFPAASNSSSYTTILIPGNTYTLNASLSGSGQGTWGVWIDYNGNNNFSDAGECVYSQSTSGSGQGISGVSITIPTTATPGIHHMRVRTQWYNGTNPYFGLGSPLTGACDNVNEDGESVDFDITIPSPSVIGPLASFSYDITTDTAWLNSPFNLVNTSNNYLHSYWDILGYSSTYTGTYAPFVTGNPRLCATRWNTCYIDTVDQNFNWVFDQIGYYKVKLKVTNTVFSNGAYRGVADSIIKIIVCAPPSQKPSASFFGANRTVGFTDHLNFRDLSLNGPTEWSWYLNPASYLTNTYGGYSTPNTWYAQNGNPADSSTQNPYLYALDGGVFDVCLAVGNTVGWDTLCRHNYLTVNNGYMMCNGFDSVSFLSTGYVYDQGGPIGNYTGATTSSCPFGFRIAACTDTLNLNIERFRLAAGDSLTIRVGTSIGSIIKRIGGKSLPDSLRNFKVPGGIAFIQMNASNTSPGDSGFAIHWTSLPASYGKPKASFTFTSNGPTTNGIPSVYQGYTIKYTNNSTGKNIGYSWDTNGDGIFGTSATGGDSISSNPSWIANGNVGLYNICLVTYNCVGSDTACKQIQVLPILNKPTADMTVNKPTGFTTDTFRFYDNSTNGAISWQWSFNPSTVVFLRGTNANSQNPIVFLNSVTCYSVTLKAFNSLGSNTKTISCMVNVFGYNSPGTAFSIPAGSDIGISRVTLGTIDTTTALQTPVYTQMNNTQIATLYRGVDYTVTTYRTTNVDPMTTRVWLDFNMNASFIDTLETIVYEKSQHKIATSQTFRMPDNNPTGNTRMRVGITYDSTTLTPDMAQLGCFEDYGIIVGIDYVKPLISLVGPAVYKMQVGKTYTELGVTAADNLEGDISSRYIRTGYLDVNTVGYYTLTYTVADLYGNVSLPVTRFVQVGINQTGPTISLVGNDTVVVGVKYNYTEQGATAIDNLGRNISNLITTMSNVNTMVLGTDSVIYSITDAFGFNATIKRTVMVVDTTKPVIVSINGKTGTDTIRYQIGTPFNYANLVRVIDNYDGSDLLIQTGSINVNVKGYYTLFFNATDASGDQANTFRLVVKIDNTILPVITLIDLPNLTVDVNTNFVDPGVNYSSAYYGYGTLVETITTNLDMTKLGTDTIIYCVNDPSGNTACVSRIVHVVDRIAPVINLIGDNPYILARYQRYFDQGVMISDNYYTDAQLHPFLIADTSNVKNDVPGIYYVTFNATDPSGNKAKTVRRTVIVQDMFGGINSVNVSGKMKIYPNPSNGKFTVELENGMTVQSIKVYSIIGSLIKEISINANIKNMEIDLTGVTDGIYLLKIDGQSGSFTQKINIVK